MMDIPQIRTKCFVPPLLCVLLNCEANHQFHDSYNYVYLQIMNKLIVKQTAVKWMHILNYKKLHYLHIFRYSKLQLKE